MVHWKEGRKVFEAKLKWNLRWCKILKKSTGKKWFCFILIDFFHMYFIVYLMSVSNFIEYYLAQRNILTVGCEMFSANTCGADCCSKQMCL